MQHDPQAQRQMASTLHTRGPRRPWLALLSSVLQLAEGKAELVRHGERPWASVTFSGSRHTIALRFAGIAALEAGDAFIEALPDHEFHIRGQIVADAAITSVEQTTLPEPAMLVEAELLLLEDA